MEEGWREGEGARQSERKGEGVRESICSLENNRMIREKVLIDDD